MSQCRAHYQHPDDGPLRRCERESGHALGRHLCHQAGEGLDAVGWSERVAIYPHEPVDPGGRPHDQVKAPSHYRFPNGAEVKDIIAWLSFWRGSAVKYICRAGHKAGVDELTDLRKARECIDNEIQRLEAAQ